MKAWTPRPMAGNMAICASCRHHREDRRRPLRCGLAIQNPYLPPLVAWKPAGDPKGLEVCSQFESGMPAAPAGQRLSLGAQS